MSLSKSKIVVVFGTRPEAIKLFPVVDALNQLDRFDVRVVASAQHRELLDQVLLATGLKPHIDLDLMTHDQSLDQLTARLLLGIGEVLDREQPSRVIVQGDTSTAMMSALAGYYRKIPVDHVEAGLRSGNKFHPWPEEANRKIIADLADLHFAPTEFAAQKLRDEGIDGARVHVVGNTVVDALLWTRQRLREDPSLTHGLDALLQRFAGRRIIVVTAHRRENFGRPMKNIARALARIAARPDIAIIIPAHPNPHVRAVMGDAFSNHDNVAVIEPLDYLHFVRLLDACHVVLTDSGGVQEEAPSLGKPVLVMRETTERTEGVLAGTARLIGTDEDRIISEIFRLLDDHASWLEMARAHNPYGDGKSGPRIAGLIADALREAA